MSDSLQAVIQQVSACSICAEHLPMGPRPVFQIAAQAKILIVGQAPGIRVHRSGVPFDDPSGDRLRQWLGITSAQFYDPKQLAILPMGFCYPGTGASGDLPPRPECAATWRSDLLAELKALRLTLLVGKYALDYHLPSPKASVTQHVLNWREYLPQIIPLPHPSPRNNIWLKKNPWFEAELLPDLKAQVSAALK